MKIACKAYAKLNLTLDVTGVLENGYHLIKSIFQSVSLYDTVSIETGGCLAFFCNDKELPTNDDNLCVAAAKLFIAETGCKIQPSIVVEKNIPVAAGLGGGSADAAAVLKLMNIACGNPLGEDGLARLALRLGADVPFCLTGGTMLAEGVGEKLKKIENNASYDIVLIKHGQKPSTGHLYRLLDGCDSLPRPDTDLAAEALSKGDIKSLSTACGNVFEAAWQPQAILPQKLLLKQNGALYSGLSGSGPTVYGIFEKRCAKNALAAAKAAFGFACVCHSENHGLEIIE